MDEKTYPLSDGLMTYDYINHRYVLTKSGVLSQLGEDLEVILNDAGDANNTSLANRVLAKVSQTVYLYLYKDSMNSDWLEFILAVHPPLREWVREMLQAQLLYVLQNGFVSDYSGVNIARGQAMDINTLRGRARISPEVEDIAMRSIPGLGYCLKYLGALPSVPCYAYHRGY